MDKIIIECIEDNKSELSRDINHTCGNIFELDKNNIFAVNTINCFSESETCYYTICPECGYLVLLEEERLTEEIKEEARNKSENDPLLYRKNNLKSQLIYLESITPKVRVRSKINW